MGKYFEEPVITDCFDAIEGVFAGSGNNDNPPPPEIPSNFKFDLSVDGNDGGSHSDIRINAVNWGPGGKGWSCTINVTDPTRTVKEVTQVGRAGVSCSYNSKSIYLSSNESYNGNENIGFTISVVFGGAMEGALYQGGYTPSKAEQEADKKLEIVGAGM